MKAPSEQGRETMLARRLEGRELDLSPWFNRPCLIVIGYLENSETPLPIRIRGERPNSNGTTVVRWIKPLEVDIREVVPEPLPKDDEEP